MMVKTILFIFSISFSQLCFSKVMIMTCSDPGKWFAEKIDIELNSQEKIASFFVKKDNYYVVVNPTSEPLYILRKTSLFQGNRKNLSKYFVKNTPYYRARKISDNYAQRPEVDLNEFDTRGEILPNGELIYGRVSFITDGWYIYNDDISLDGTFYEKPKEVSQYLGYSTLSELAFTKVSLPDLHDAVLYDSQLKKKDKPRPKDAKPPPPVRLDLLFEYQNKIIKVPVLVTFVLNDKYDIKKYPYTCKPK